MEPDEVLKIKRIAKSVKVKDKETRWQIAEEMNEIAKIIIEIYQIKKRGEHP